MADRDVEPPVQEGAKRLQFDCFVLDLHRGCLLLDGNEIVLRPKTFGVLRHLVENTGRLISKDELFAAVWPNLAITDDALVQSIGELRRALGDDGPRLITTIPRRGYRFEAAVTVVAPDDPIVADRKANLAASRAGDPSFETATPRDSTLFWTALTGRRAGLFAAMVLVIALAAAALWTGFGS